MKFCPPVPDIQIAFCRQLVRLKNSHLQEALQKTVANANISQIDEELGKLVPKKFLQLLAQYGLRGELVFPVPYILKHKPILLGYYRLLLGLSQKSFYGGLGYGVFSSMEKRGVISEIQQQDLEDLCRALIKSASILLDSIEDTAISKQLLNELSLLTLGAQLRGSRNNELGSAATGVVFKLIKNIVLDHIISSTDAEIVLQNAAGREISIRFASDPDIIITEKFRSGNERNLIAVEIKGGTDYSNAHNRLGEAEKSHQKAKLNGFTEFWTLTGFSIDRKVAREESPTTTDFYFIKQLMDKDSSEYKRFQENIIGLTGIVENG